MLLRNIASMLLRGSECVVPHQAVMGNNRGLERVLLSSPAE